MLDIENTVLFRFRFVIAGVFAVICIILLSFLLTAIHSGETASAASIDSSPITTMSDDSNAVSAGLFTAVTSTGRVATAIGNGVTNGTQSGARSVVSATTWCGRTTVASGAFVGRGLLHGLTFFGQGIGTGALFLIRTPATVFGLVTKAPVVSNIIEPPDHTPVPTIDANSTAVLTARDKIAAIPVASPANPAPAPDLGGSWPMHGAVTTEFGEPEWPYQAVHTGIDISDGNGMGTTAIRPFRPGTVTQVFYSSRGLGNHIVVDHGSGVTSVYGHLYIISVQPGQAVTKASVLGYEGTTGASTGAHLHFEIRVDGAATDPRKFIAGQP